MKKTTFSFLILCLFTPLFMMAFENLHLVTTDTPYLADPVVKVGNQMTLLDNLIEVTKENLDNQKKVREMVQEYLFVQNQYMKDTSNKEQAFRMVKVAYRLLEKIKETQLVQAFDSEFIGELTMFSQIAAKRMIPSPS